mmetsp:Transcript_61226/g.150649  ORF Transcript_61226/g.150649 Transcript_61226/m.150649 type:complete len:214 (-) Transcript_61226:526-1167(-)
MGGQFGRTGEVGQQVGQVGDRDHRQPVALLHLLHGRVLAVDAALGRLFLAVQRDGDATGGRAGGLDHLDGFTHRGAGGDHVVDDQHAALDRRTDQGAALAVVLGFLAVVGERQVVAAPGEFHRHRGRQRDALVGRAEDHVEVQARGDQAFGIEAGETAQLGAVVEQAGVEEIGAEPAGLGLELAKAQHAGLDGERDKGLGEGIGGRGGHGNRF